MDQQPTSPTSEQNTQPQIPQQPAIPIQDTPTQQAAENTPSVPAVSIPPSSGTDGKKKQLMIIAGVLVVALFLFGSVVYIIGVINRTQRLGSYSANPIKIQSTPKQTELEQSALSPEEQEAAAVDTGDPESDLLDLEKDLSVLDN